jgi:hypothetical protein
VRQVLLNIYDDGSLHLYEVHATVPSGMGVILGGMRTDQIVPMKVALEPLYNGDDANALTGHVERLRKIAGEPVPRRPWSD